MDVTQQQRQQDIFFFYECKLEVPLVGTGEEEPGGSGGCPGGVILPAAKSSGSQLEYSVEAGRSEVATRRRMALACFFIVADSSCLPWDSHHSLKSSNASAVSPSSLPSVITRNKSKRCLKNGSHRSILPAASNVFTFCLQTRT